MRHAVPDGHSESAGEPAPAQRDSQIAQPALVKFKVILAAHLQQTFRKNLVVLPQTNLKPILIFLLVKARRTILDQLGKKRELDAVHPLRKCRVGFPLNSGKSQQLVDEAKIGFLQNSETNGRIRVQIGLVVKVILLANEIRANERRCRRSEYITALEQPQARNFPAGHNRSGKGQAAPQ